MSKYPDGEKMSDIIRGATEKKIALTEELIANASQEEAGEDIIPVMVNGTEHHIGRVEYAAFKEKTAEIKKQMKSDLKAAVSEVKSKS